MRSTHYRAWTRSGWVGTLLFFLAVAPSFPVESVLTLSPESTKVTFELGATGHDVHGNLYLRSGEITLDLDQGVATGDIVIDAVKTETGSERRDRDMHEKVLESSLFPVFVFSAEKVVGDLAPMGKSSLQLIGQLSIHGDDHPMTLDVAVDNEDGQLHATTTFDVPFVEWGMKDPSVFVLRVAKVVSVSVATDARLETAILEQK